ncbi:hypothetical protein Ancab_023219 [Ancistrocladus abbreviatus]
MRIKCCGFFYSQGRLSARVTYDMFVRDRDPNGRPSMHDFLRKLRNMKVPPRVKLLLRRCAVKVLPTSDLEGNVKVSHPDINPFAAALGNLVLLSIHLQRKRILLIMGLHGAAASGIGQRFLGCILFNASNVFQEAKMISNSGSDPKEAEAYACLEGDCKVVLDSIKSKQVSPWRIEHIARCIHEMKEEMGISDFCSLDNNSTPLPMNLLDRHV